MMKIQIISLNVPSANKILRIIQVVKLSNLPVIKIIFSTTTASRIGTIRTLLVQLVLKRASQASDKSSLSLKIDDYVFVTVPSNQ